MVLLYSRGCSGLTQQYCGSTTVWIIQILWCYCVRKQVQCVSTWFSLERGYSRAECHEAQPIADYNISAILNLALLISPDLTSETQHFAYSMFSLYVQYNSHSKHP
jgi:hypothetical protein